MNVKKTFWCNNRDWDTCCQELFHCKRANLPPQYRRDPPWKLLYLRLHKRNKYCNNQIALDTAKTSPQQEFSVDCLKSFKHLYLCVKEKKKRNQKKNEIWLISPFTSGAKTHSAKGVYLNFIKQCFFSLREDYGYEFHFEAMSKHSFKYKAEGHPCTLAFTKSLWGWVRARWDFANHLSKMALLSSFPSLVTWITSISSNKSLLSKKELRYSHGFQVLRKVVSAFLSSCRNQNYYFFKNNINI